MQCFNLFIDKDLPPTLSDEEFNYYYHLMKLGDPDARNTIIYHNIRLVLKEVTTKFAKNLYEIKDLVSIGIIGLIKAVDTFNPYKKSRFSSYAAICIDNEIKMYFRKISKVYANDISFEGSISTDCEGNELSLEDTLVDIKANFAQQYEDREVGKIIREIVYDLGPRDKFVMIHRFGFEGYEPVSQAQVARYLGISRSYVSRIERRVLRKIKNELETREYIDYNIPEKKRKPRAKKLGLTT